MLLAVTCATASWLALGCGPELGPDDVLASGYYRTEHVGVDDPCSSSGIRSDAYPSLYAEPVPIRSDGERLEVPDIATIGHSPDPHTVVVDIAGWKMLPLMWQGASFDWQVTLHDDERECYRFSWTAVALDAETVHVTREGTSCDDGPDELRACDSVLELELALEQPCESPCVFVDDRDSLFPEIDLGDDILLHASRCECG